MCRRLSLEWRFSNNNSYMINNLSHIVFHWCRDGEMMIDENQVKLLTDPFIFSESCDCLQISNPCKFKWSMMKLWNILFCFIFARPSDGQWQQWGGRITTKSPQVLEYHVYREKQVHTQCKPSQRKIYFAQKY